MTKGDDVSGEQDHRDRQSAEMAQAREAALRDILQVISRSRDDEKPVLEKILESARRLCETPTAAMVMGRAGDKCQTLAAHHGVSDATIELYRSRQFRMDPKVSLAARAIVECRVIHVEDMAETKGYRDGLPQIRSLVEEQGIRTNLFVPLIAQDGAIGAFVLFRQEVRPYTEGQIALVETFAEQAVIAIEKVRQFRELQMRLQREAATREILEVISRSRDDETPVFDSILKAAQRLCNAPLAFLSMADENRTHVTIPAQRGARPTFAEVLAAFVEPVERTDLLPVRSVLDPRVIRMDDVADEDLYRARDPRRVQMVEVEGVRSILVVPLISGDRGIGGIVLYRREVLPFSDDDVVLVQSLAKQAVIAIENVRQFRALEARTEEVRAQAAELQTLNAELESRVAGQVDQLERLGRLRRFLSPQVADAVLSSGDETMLGSHRALIAVLFCDIRGFTAFCERAEPEETIEVLQTYHEEMGALIRTHGAGVDHRSGDGIMAIFNDPLRCEDPAGDAVRMALAMRERMATLCGRWKRFGHQLGFGVGISLGYATVGMVGSEGRYDYTASGTAVNLAARLCDEAADGEILLSPRACAAVEEGFETVARGTLAFKGIQAPVEVHCVIGAREG
jgi:class 3 adenylate cyclase